MEKEEEDLEQVAALVSCSAAVQSYIKHLEWREKMAIEIYKMGTYFRHEARGRVRGTAHEGFLSTWSCMFLRLMQAEGFNIQTILIFYRSCVCPGILMGDVLQKVPQVQVWAAAWA